MLYTSGCSELDDRVLGNDVTGRLAGGVVGISADGSDSSDGDIGTSVALQVAVQHLRCDVDGTATARLVTTRPMDHAVQLLRGVVKSLNGLDKPTKASILSRVLISRIYGHDELEAVLAELEAGVPFEWLRSVANESRNETSSACPSIIIFTEMDHHFRWMRLQGQSGRMHEVYGHLMRRLRALAGGLSLTGSRRLVIVLNSTLTRVPDQKSEARSLAAARDDDSTTYRLALAALQQGRHVGRPAALRLCCSELARAQCSEPRYRDLLNYYCSLHVCLTRLPAELVAMWAGAAEYKSNASSLWVGTVETDENELGQCMADRVGVVSYSQGVVRDAVF